MRVLMCPWEVTSYELQVTRIVSIHRFIFLYEEYEIYFFHEKNKKSVEIIYLYSITIFFMSFVEKL